MEENKEIVVQIINAFVDNGAGGNPAGVVLDADRLTSEQKIEIAKKIGLSETAFVSKSDVADFKLDFFTPNKQIAHCGHATIATFSYLSQQNIVERKQSSKETIDGTREISLEGDLAFIEQKAPQYIDTEKHNQRILLSLGLTKEDLLDSAAISLVNTGSSFVIIPVESAAILRGINPDFKLIDVLSEELDLIGFYVFTTETMSCGRDASTRMFAPRYGIEEEAATGTAAGPLSCYLYDKLEMKKEQFLIEQGAFMIPPSPSLIIVNLTFDHTDSIDKVMVGGKGISMRRLTVSLD